MSRRLLLVVLLALVPMAAPGYQLAGYIAG
jgi:hypothetical protein